MDKSSELARALAVLPDRVLLGLQIAIAITPNVAPALAEWIAHAVDWEINRRSGRHFALQDPRAAIKDSEVDESLMALAVLTARFRDGAMTAGAEIAAFLDVTAATLRAEFERPGTLQ